MKNANKGDASTLISQLDGKKLRIGIVQARFNADITDALAEACLSELMQLGVKAKNVTLVQVPGALEIPLALQALADRLHYDALIALGCIIRGETYHFELVANESGAGVTRIALDHALPIANAILTVDNIKQAKERQIEKGVDAARVAVEMALLMRAV
ncbi:MAG: 6,7-dimethyl-8-ribityllumazine synthase [Brachymonas sp.]|jgi:6,7-dimethyl-8-ribityllumazine synthase|nr:6,7-dimethyl-8-ribityllumazine synthase [Brachymonas sp.]MBP6139556.1 6,7-dimethyl-8-ribityllumazine synthase [Brachymonas sp.]MBP6967355.1 6,7-dimethyl-8-ribityllumazine synthase [Brachymonas sp.]MBP7247356.1 6,7-dimethyl-8-ribityllumazine synthase [Brachymonas sp.]MBP7740126.1 6,7-dimethyl-8-ribityllumazine synthase [Brachymonas sp.]